MALTPKKSSHAVAASPAKKDLRSGHQDRKRDKESKTKWAPKWRAHFDAPSDKMPSEKHPRPPAQRPGTTGSKAMARANNCKPLRHAHEEKKRPTLADDDDDAVMYTDDETDSSGNDDQARIIDSIQFQYNGSGRAPAEGKQVFKTLVGQAIERFEDQEMIKLVNNEYEVLDHDDDDDDGAAAMEDDDDDFELV